MSDNPIILSDNHKNLSLVNNNLSQPSRIKQMILSEVMGTITTEPTTNWQDLEPYEDETTEKWGYKNKNTGKVIIKPKYDYAYSFSEGLGNVELNDKEGFINKDGIEVIQIKYDYLDDFNRLSEGLAKVKLNSKWGFINRDEVEIIAIKYDYVDILGFSDELIRVELNNKWGFVNKNGVEVIPLKYDYARSFSRELTQVKINSKWGMINSNGEEIIAIKYDYIEDFDIFSDNIFPEGITGFRLNDKWGKIDKQGNEYWE